MHPTSHLSTDGTSLDAILERYRVLPDPLASYEQAERRAHRDLEQMDAVVLRQELAALRLWLSVQRSAHPWFRERVQQLQRVLRDGR